MGHVLPISEVVFLKDLYGDDDDDDDRVLKEGGQTREIVRTIDLSTLTPTQKSFHKGKLIAVYRA